MNILYRYSIAFFVFAVGVCCPYVTRASDVLTDSIDEVVVTGTRLKTAIRQLPLTLSVIDRATIINSQHINLLPIVNEQVPGLFVTSRGLLGYGVSTGAAGGLKMRGVGGSPTTEMMVLVDGHPQYTGLMGHTVADAYQSLLAERVEVVRGPASVLYGSNAMGGVMNIITRQANRNGYRQHLMLQGGSYGTIAGDYVSELRLGSLTNVVGVAAAASDGHRRHMHFEQYTFFDKFAYQLNKHWSVLADVNLTHYISQNPGTVFVPMLDNIMNIRRGVASASIQNEYRNMSGSATYYTNWGHHKINDGYAGGSKPRDYLFHLRDHMYGVHLYETFKLFTGNHTTFGFDYQHTDGTAWNAAMADGARSYLADDRQTDELAGYILFRQSLLSFLTLDAGLRYNHHSVSGSSWIPQIGLSYRPTSASTLKAMVSKGFRNPTLRELYMFRSANPALNPERLMNYELSWAQTVDSHFNYSLNVFYLNADNLIQTNMVNGRMQNENIGKTENWGIEATAAYRLSADWCLNGNYSFLHTSKVVTSAPRHKLYVGIDYIHGRWNVSTGAQWVGHLVTSTEKDASAESYVLWNARLAYQALAWLRLQVSGENLLAQRYETYAGFTMPRATVMGGFSIDI
uniref:TonB-dependent receptor n=1 Tax=Prevotella sp. GTC17259 TaxID=3236795 RepID=A0AB33J8S7_9BACT